MMFSIHIPGIPARVSEVHLGAGLLKNVPRAVAEHSKGHGVFWIVDENVWNIWGARFIEWGWPNLQSGKVLLFPASESNKHVGAVEELARRLVRAGADRGSSLVAVGGGVTGDVTGFLASIYMRGIPHYQVPTTLLAQVDSSIGGKTGVDLPEGKNLIGTFHQPEIIWMDLQVLKTLSEEDFRQGMAEVIKTAMIGDEVLWKYLETHREAIHRREEDALFRIVSACCNLKARVVAADEREAGYRRVLNLGHTVGHALERVSSYSVRHGDAVAVGLIASARLSARLGNFPSSNLQQLTRFCTDWGLPVTMPQSCMPEDVMKALETDKKSIGGKFHFILPIGIGEVVEYDFLDRRALLCVLMELQS